MNRTEAITQLNQERKRKENRVWEEWFVTESKNQVTSERLQKRTDELNKIRDEYEKALFRINNQPQVQENSLPLQTKTNQLSSALSTRKLTPQVQKQAPQDEILKGAENLPENKRISLGQSVRKPSVDGIQSKDNTPEIVRSAQAQNRSDEIRQAQKENVYQDENINAEGGDNNETAQADIIRDEFRAAGINLADVASSDSDSELIEELKSAKKSSLIRFPIIILFVAFLKDLSDVFSSIFESIPVVGILVWIFAAAFSILCSVIIWFWMLGKGSKMQRKIIINFVRNRLPVIMVGLFGEVIPWISLIPTTTITVFFIAQTSTKLGQTIHKAVEKVEGLKS